MSNYTGYNDPFKSLDANGAIAGGQIGWNFQRGSYVFGLEADLDWSNFGGKKTRITDDYSHGFAKTHDSRIHFEERYPEASVMLENGGTVEDLHRMVS